MENLSIILLALSYVMLKSGQTYFHHKILKVCLAIFQHYTWKG